MHNGIESTKFMKRIRFVVIFNLRAESRPNKFEMKIIRREDSKFFFLSKIINVDIDSEDMDYFFFFRNENNIFMGYKDFRDGLLNLYREQVDAKTMRKVYA